MELKILIFSLLCHLPVLRLWDSYVQFVKQGCHSLFLDCGGPEWWSKAQLWMLYQLSLITGYSKDCTYLHFISVALQSCHSLCQIALTVNFILSYWFSLLEVVHILFIYLLVLHSTSTLHFLMKCLSWCLFVFPVITSTRKQWWVDW